MIFNELLATLPAESHVPYLIGVVIGALISAFFGFRLFKLSVVLSFASFGFLLGNSVLGTALGDGVEGANVALILGIALAVVFGLIALKIYKAMIYLAGGMFGAVFGFIIPAMIFYAFELEIIGLIVGLVLAVVFAILCAKGFMKIMKPLVIIDTAIGGMMLAFEALATIILGENVLGFIGIVYLVGLIAGIFAAKTQFKMNKGRELFEKN